MREQEAVRRVDLIGQPPPAHQPERSGAQRGIVGGFEVEEEIERKKCEPDPGGVSIDWMDLRSDGINGLPPRQAIVRAECLVEGNHPIQSPNHRS